MKQITSFIIITILTITNSMASTHYSVSFSKAKAHYVHVDLSLDAGKREFVDFKMPVWTPGSYKIREFSMNIDVLTAKDDKGTPLKISRINKNTWRINSGGNITISYDVYAFIFSVRQSYVDEYMAFLHGVSVFGYADGFEQDEVILELMPLENWKNVEIAAEQLKRSGYVFRLDNYDLLADSPIALGNFDTVDYTSGNVPHRVVMIGRGNYDLERIAKDFKAINDKEVELFGSHPSKPKYIHFIQNINNGSGGLEHLNSQTSQMEPFGYTDEVKYSKFLGLVAHEYFHLWNVKRIRPAELGPFNYDAENYTELLWIAEGITSYYDDMFLKRCELISAKEYMDLVAAQINRYENMSGKHIMTLAESSRLAWIKAYLPNENSSNTSISYYNKGMLVTLVLDLKIIANSKGKHCFDDVLRELYAYYLSHPDLNSTEGGITYDYFVSVCNKYAAEDLSGLLHQMVFTTEPIDYNSYFGAIGVDVNVKRFENEAWSGISASENAGKWIISRIHSNGPAENAGLSVNDELISVDGLRLDLAWDMLEKRYKVGDTIQIEFSRNGTVYSKSVTLAANPKLEYSLQPKEKHSLMDCWLKQD